MSDLPPSRRDEREASADGGCRIEWTCLDCGAGSVHRAGFKYDVERASKSVISWHDLTQPGCRGAPDSIRLREISDDERDARLRAG